MPIDMNKTYDTKDRLVLIFQTDTTNLVLILYLYDLFS